MRILPAILISLAIASCNNSGQSNTADEKADTKKSPSTASQNVRNDIEFKASGLKVSQAFLMFEDGKLVPQDNKVEIGQKVKLHLIIENWKPVNGKVMLGASEKITADEGQVILDSEDLFAAYPDGVDPVAAGTIMLSAVITEIHKLVKYFEVSFRVWDKASKDNITGSYRLYLK
jgi:hypothetical protein